MRGLNKWLTLQSETIGLPCQQIISMLMRLKKTGYMYIVIIAALWYLLVWNSQILGHYGGAPALVALGFTLIYILHKRNDFVEKQVSTRMLTNFLVYATWAISYVLLIWYASKIFARQPIDIRTSDIIPLLKEVYYERFAAGEYVYAIVHGYDYVMWTPNYLPMHWLPFVPAFAMQLDPRYVSLIVFGAVQLYYINGLLKQEVSLLEKMLKSILPLLLLVSVMYKQEVAFAHTIELLIVSYYSLLLTALVNNHTWSISGGLFLTSMSRYISVFFMPLHLLSLWAQNKFQVLRIYGLLALLVLVGYIIPFVWQQPTVFFDGAAAYDAAALGEWKGQSWQAPGSNPYQLYQGYGFAAHIYAMVGINDLMKGVQLIKICMFGSLLLLILGWAIYLKKYAEKTITAYPSILFSTLFVMFVFVTVPYNYLFWNVLFAVPVITVNRKWL